ncbi:MAG: biosynthetic peptidoglycan transglycosylase [Gemmatimonadales bacterium]
MTGSPSAPNQPPAPEQPTVAGWRRWLRPGRLLLLALVLFFLWIVSVWPPPIYYRWFWPHQTAFMSLRARQADSLGRHAQRRREAVDGRIPRRYTPVSMGDITPTLARAVLVAEDHRFLEHGGIDYQELRVALGYRRDAFAWGDPADRRELWRVVGRLWSRRNQIRGASTITEQLAKNLYLSPSRNPLRKVKEAVTAYRLEWALGKGRILELYLNVVEFGPEVWGAEAAAQTYFGRSAARLSADQAAALAGTLPFPLSSNPGFRPARMRWRQQLILRRMRGEPIQIPSDAEAIAAKETPADSATR